MCYKHVQACDVKFELCLKYSLSFWHTQLHTCMHTHTFGCSVSSWFVSLSHTHCALTTGVNHSRSAHTRALRGVLASHNINLKEKKKWQALMFVSWVKKDDDIKKEWRKEKRSDRQKNREKRERGMKAESEKERERSECPESSARAFKYPY